MKNFIAYIFLIALLASCSSNSNPEQPESSTPSTETSATESSQNPDMTEFAAEVDTNQDGQMSREEWSAKGLPESSFNGFENGRGYVTLEDYQKNPAPPGIDLNNDGKLTVAEFVEFDKQMSEKMKDGEAPPPPPNQ